MPQSAKTFTPIAGAIYEVLVSKLGPDEDDWTYGKRLEAEEFPTFDFERLRKDGAVKRVDTAYLIEQIQADAPAPDPHVVQLAQPHREYALESTPVVAPEPSMAEPRTTG